MYNIDFLPQMEKFRNDFYRDLNKFPHLTAPMKRYRCVEDTNGEWVPERDEDGKFVYVD